MRARRFGALTVCVVCGCDGPVDGVPGPIDAAFGGPIDAAFVGPADAALAVRIAPEVPRVGDLVACAARGPAATLAWTRDGAPAGEGEHVRAEVAGERLVCTATPDDGGAPVEAWVTVVAPRAPGNVLLVIGDDVGVDKVAAYGMGVDPPPTPTLDRLAAEGVRFTRAWAYPSCSPTRSAVQTGRYGHDTGLGVITGQVDGWQLSHDELTLPERIAAEGPVAYASAMVGKWHLGPHDADEGRDPVEQGYGSYRGVPQNLGLDIPGLDGKLNDWFDHDDEDGAGGHVRRTTYLTVQEAEDALDAIRTLPEPWLVVLAFHAPHLPAHQPPPGLYPSPHVSVLAPIPDKVDAAIQAMDHELGRVLDALSPDDTVIFVGDNGTDPKASRGPYPKNETKRTIDEGGIRVPLLVRSPWVTRPGSEATALVHVVDLHATVAELAGVPMPLSQVVEGTDSHSLLAWLVDPGHPSWRDVVYTERFRDNGFGPYTEHLRAVRDERYKLTWSMDGAEELHDLGVDGWLDGPDLLDAPLSAEAAAAYDRLSAALDGDRFRRLGP